MVFNIFAYMLDHNNFINTSTSCFRSKVIVVKTPISTMTTPMGVVHHI